MPSPSNRIRLTSPCGGAPKCDNARGIAPASRPDLWRSAVVIVPAIAPSFGTPSTMASSDPSLSIFAPMAASARGRSTASTAKTSKLPFHIVVVPSTPALPSGFFQNFFDSLPTAFLKVVSQI